MKSFIKEKKPHCKVTLNFFFFSRMLLEPNEIKRRLSENGEEKEKKKQRKST